jgi:hypothetical protein
MPVPKRSLGTGWGERILDDGGAAGASMKSESPVSRNSFEKAENNCGGSRIVYSESIVTAGVGI